MTLHDLRANLHRPTDPALIAAEIQRLAAYGLTARDISVALRLPMGAILQAIRAPLSASGAAVAA